MRAIVCDKCGKEFFAGNRADGVPNGVGLQLKNGDVINVCAECIEDIAQEVKETGKCDWLDAIKE